MTTQPPPQVEQTERAVSGAPSIEAARRMGATGGPATEAERLAFEAWMAGHCWALSAAWTGSQYLGSSEVGGNLCPHAVRTRQLWAAWRDRAALAKAKGPGSNTEASEAGQEPPTHGASVAALQREVEELRNLVAAQGGEHERAMRVADIAAEELVCSEGHFPGRHREYVFEKGAVDEHLLDCIEHLCWRGLATRRDEASEIVLVLADPDGYVSYWRDCGFIVASDSQPSETSK